MYHSQCSLHSAGSFVQTLYSAAHVVCPCRHGDPSEIVVSALSPHHSERYQREVGSSDQCNHHWPQRCGRNWRDGINWYRICGVYLYRSNPLIVNSVIFPLLASIGPLLSLSLVCGVCVCVCVCVGRGYVSLS